MMKTTVPLSIDPKVNTVVEDLHRRSQRQIPLLIGYYLTRSIPRWIKGDQSLEVDDRAQSFLSNKLIALARDKCEFCYLLCRSLAARHIVEIGTSFGVSTIYLAAAARDAAQNGGQGSIVVGTEIDNRKVAIARQNLERAGLSAFADVRHGDARLTLCDDRTPIDFVLIDSWIPLARPMIEMLAPRLRPGSAVVCDNTAQFSKQYRDYLDFVRAPENGFQSTLIPYRGGLELSVRR